jgi:thioester reductase-like protein
MGYHTATGRYADTIPVTMVAGGAITATTTSTGIELGDRGTLRLTLTITAATGTTPTLDVAVQTSPDNTNWTAVAAFSQQTAAGSVRKVFAGMDRYARVVETVGGTTPSFTRTLSGEAV